ncbi:MAG: hypothetical protein AB2A00_31305 [Myxococcota bacterium]
MPVTVTLHDNLAVWIAEGPVTTSDLTVAFQRTAPIRERHAGRGRLLVVWGATVEPDVGAELAHIHRWTANLFDRIICVANAPTLALLLGHADTAPGAPRDVEPFGQLDAAMDRLLEGASAPTRAQLQQLLPLMRVTLSRASVS